VARRPPPLVTAVSKHEHHHEHHWTNWGGNQHVHPVDVLTPSTEDELADIVSRGVAGRRSVRAVGSGHSFTDIACADEGVMVGLGAFTDILHVERATNRVTVGAGVVLADLNAKLWDLGLALPNLGDIDAQTLAGATATATHGTGAGHQCISAAVVGARMVTGDGALLEISETQRPDLLGPVRASLGALGIITTLTLQCEPAFNLRRVETTHHIDELLDGFDEAVAANEHVEFYWFPGTAVGQLLRNNRTNEPAAPRSRASAFINDELVANGAFGLINRIGRRFPKLVAPTLARVVRPGDHTEYIAPSHKVFCSKRRVRFVEMEYAIPRDNLHEAFGRVRSMIEAFAYPISFPIEVRVLGSDDIPLGTASGRDTAYIACHMYRGTPFADYFAAVETIMRDYDGRPHWGKMHYRSAADLAPSYPGWEDFHTALDELDPDGHFSNAYLDRVLRGSDFRRRGT
jgi:FAD-linked oxidoreductase